MRTESDSFSFDITGVQIDDKARAMSKIEVDVEEVEDEEDVYEEEEGQSLPLVRRLTRVSTKPAYLDDYVLFADIECEKLLMI